MNNILRFDGALHVAYEGQVFENNVWRLVNLIR